ncbi:MAG: pyridoxamine 5'-phosphate oxidase family protein [Candidatus Binatia bacterium]|nr:pyridoxamine 5'-phosphate oxidase family protein [Candidatus Binatia bacterium]
MKTARFEDIADEFKRRVEHIVWCSATTVDTRGRPRSRILHPVWDGPVGWIATGRHSLKGKHLAKNRFLSLSYWTPEQEQVHAECATSWEERVEEKRRLWDFFKELPAPVGYDPGLFFQGGPEDPECGFLRLDPWRLELWSLNDLITGTAPQVWRPASS